MNIEHVLADIFTMLDQVFDITAEKQIKSVPLVTNYEEHQTSGKRNDITTPTPDVPPSRRGGTDRTILTGGITLSVGLFFLASLLLLYIFIHTRRRPEKLEDNNTVESSYDLEGARPDIVVVEPSSPEQPICGLSVDIAPSIMKELKQISPLRSPNCNREKSNHKRMFSKSKKNRYNAQRRGADLKLKLDTIEEDDSSSHSSSEYYTDTSRNKKYVLFYVDFYKKRSIDGLGLHHTIDSRYFSLLTLKKMDEYWLCTCDYSTLH